MVGLAITVIGLMIICLIGVEQFRNKERRALKAIKHFVILFSFICLLLQYSIEWSTYSYFFTGASLENVFTAGTWEIPEEPQPPIESGSAWAGEIAFSGGIAKYFTYNMNQGTDQSPVAIPLYQGADWVPVGTVTVWNTQDTLTVKTVTFPSYSSNLIHMYPGLVPPEKHSPGNLGYQYGSSHITEHTFTASSVFAEWDNKPEKRSQTPVANLTDNETIYIAVHANMYHTPMQQSASSPVTEELKIPEEPQQEEVPFESEEPLKEEIPTESEEPLKEEIPSESEEPLKEEIPSESEELPFEEPVEPVQDESSIENKE